MHFNGNGRVARHAATTKLFWPESTQGPQKAALERCFRARHKRQIDDQLIDLHAGMQRYIWPRTVPRHFTGVRAARYMKSIYAK